jgi:CRISPR-associated exonuclease Cas4
MTYSEDELLPLSALQHLLFCERQCALIHLEQVWQENRLTVEGRLLHERVHEQEAETRGDLRIARGVRLRSLKLGLIGMADVVEFHRTKGEDEIVLPDAAGRWRPFPVEYKRGRPKPDRCDTVQLCAQGMCLEEMLCVFVSGGALFYGQPRRRQEVAFDAELRQTVETAAQRLHALIGAGVTPPAVYEKKCENCSMIDICMPKTAGQNKSAVAYLDEVVK